MHNAKNARHSVRVYFKEGLCSWRDFMLVGRFGNKAPRTSHAISPSSYHRTSTYIYKFSDHTQTPMLLVLSILSQSGNIISQLGALDLTLELAYNSGISGKT